MSTFVFLGYFEQELIKRYPKDSRGLLYLAEIYLNNNDIDKNLELLQKAEEIDKDFWLLQLEQLVRKKYLGEKIDFEKIDENNFPRDPKIKSNYYRIYALFFEDENEHIKADSFIEKAIFNNPEGISNYLVKLSFLEKRMLSDQYLTVINANKLLFETNKVESKCLENGSIGSRNKAFLNLKKLNALRALEKIPEFEKIAKETFELLLTCYFDNKIDQMITINLQFVALPNDDLNRLVQYITNSNKNISDNLSNVFLYQYNIRDKLLTDGKKFFTNIKNTKYLILLC